MVRICPVRGASEWQACLCDDEGWGSVGLPERVSETGEWQSQTKELKGTDASIAYTYANEQPGDVNEPWNQNSEWEQYVDKEFAPVKIVVDNVIFSGTEMMMG